jgi:hypothetical protein
MRDVAFSSRRPALYRSDGSNILEDTFPPPAVRTGLAGRLLYVLYVHKEKVTRGGCASLRAKRARKGRRHAIRKADALILQFVLAFENSFTASVGRLDTTMVAFVKFCLLFSSLLSKRFEMMLNTHRDTAHQSCSSATEKTEAPPFFLVSRSFPPYDCRNKCCHNLAF